jgi:hypothetical protein
MAHLTLQRWQRYRCVGEFGCKIVTESVKPNVVCWYPQLLRIGFSTYLTKLSLLSGFVPLQFGNSRTRAEQPARLHLLLKTRLR